MHGFLFYFSLRDHAHTLYTIIKFPKRKIHDPFNISTKKNAFSFLFPITVVNSTLTKTVLPKSPFIVKISV